MDLLKGFSSQASTTDLTGCSINRNSRVQPPASQPYRFGCRPLPPAEPKSKPTHSGPSLGHKKSKHQVMNESSFFRQISEEKRLHALTQNQGFASGRQRLMQRTFPSARATDLLPTAFSFSLFKFLPPRLTSLTGSSRHDWPSSPLLLTPLETYKKTGPGSSARNRKITESEFGSPNKAKALPGASGLLRAAIPAQRGAQSIARKAARASWESALFPHNLSIGHPQATSLKVMVGA